MNRERLHSIPEKKESAAQTELEVWKVNVGVGIG
jgi:hypothetical protein